MDDLISRQAVIEMLDETRRIAERNIDGAVLMTFERVFDSLVNITNALPTIHPEPHWIPVTERLPEINEDILLSYFDEVTLGWLCGDGSWMIFDGQECVGANEVSAWMPLPEPYKGVTDGTD